MGPARIHFYTLYDVLLLCYTVGNGSTWQSEIDTIDSELENLSQRKLELHRQQEEIEYSSSVTVAKQFKGKSESQGTHLHSSIQISPLPVSSYFFSILYPSHIEDVVISTQNVMPGFHEPYIFVEPPPSITGELVTYLLYKQTYCIFYLWRYVLFH